MDFFLLHQCNHQERAPQFLGMRALGGTLLLTAALGLAQEPFQPPVAEIAVHGTVRNAATGQPLPRALVEIEGDSEAGALTNGDGHFELHGVPVGPQIIRVRKPGFHDRPYATEDAGFQVDGPAHNVLVEAGMPELAFALTPTSAISGHVELSTGDPAQGITVTLLKQVIRNGRAVWALAGTTRSNGEGAYRFAGLSSGVYALYSQPAPESEAAAVGANVTRQSYPSIFYPEEREFSDAARIRLVAGEQARANLRLTLEPFYTVTATAILPNGQAYGGSGLDGASSYGPLGPVMVLDAAERRQAYIGEFNAATKSIQALLPDGSFALLVHLRSPEALSAEAVKRRPEELSGFAEFSVEGRAPANLRIPLTPTPNWPIQLRIARTAAKTRATAGNRTHNLVTVTSIDADEAPMDGDIEEIITQEAGAELLELHARPGSHWLSTQVNDHSLCITSFTAGGVNLAREPLHVPLGASPPPMELTLSDDCAQLTLSLPPALSTFLPGDEPFYTVYLVPDFDTTVDLPPLNVHPSSGATLTIEGLTPGSYHVYTFDHPVRLEYRNPSALAALPTPGQAITLTAGATGNLVLEVPGR